MFLQVDGWFGGGKSVLHYLLDGNNQVFASPVHDYSYAAFLTERDDLDWVTTKHTEILRKALARTQYYKFEKTFHDGFRIVDFSTSEILKMPYTLDYYKFDKNIFSSLVKEGKWTINLINDIIYKSIYNESELYNAKISPRYFASMGNPLFIDYYEKMPVLFPFGKSLQVRRDIIDLMAIRSNRKPHQNDFKTKSFFSDSFDKRIAEGEVEKILYYYDKLDKLENLFPDFFRSVNFTDVIKNTEKTMREVAAFLNIPFTDDLIKCTFMGTEIICNGKKYIGQENDNIYELLTDKEISIIQERIFKYNDSKIKL